MRPKESECRACGKPKEPGECCRRCLHKRLKLYAAGHQGKEARRRAMKAYRDRKKNNVIDIHYEEKIKA